MVGSSVKNDLATGGPTIDTGNPSDPTHPTTADTPVWAVRASSDDQADRFITDGYVEIGWIDLASIPPEQDPRSEIWKRVKQEHPNPGSSIVGQLWSFRFEMSVDDYVIIPTTTGQLLHYGKITGDCESFLRPHLKTVINRRSVHWNSTPLHRLALSNSLQRTLESDPFVFRVKQTSDFTDAITSSIEYVREKDDSGLEKEKDDERDDPQVQPFESSNIRVQTNRFSIGQVIKRIDYDEIDLQPDFQRKVGVWDAIRRSRLIESLLLRIPIHLFYVSEDENEKWTVVDGVQRISTINDYVKDRFSLARMEYRQDLNGKLHRDLPRPLQRRIDETQVDISVISPGTPKEVMFNIFSRINTGGMPLTAQEVRHAIVQGPVREFLKKLAETEEFLDATGSSVSTRRMADRECVLRFLAFYVTPWQDYSAKSLDAHLISAMETINAMSRRDRDLTECDFRKAMLASKEIFGDRSFRKISLVSDRKNPVNKSLLEVWSVVLAKCSTDHISCLIDRRDEVTLKFATVLREDAEFEKSISVSTGSPKKIQKRFATISSLVNEFA